MKQAGAGVLTALLALVSSSLLVSSTETTVTCGNLGSLPLPGCLSCEEVAFDKPEDSCKPPLPLPAMAMLLAAGGDPRDLGEDFELRSGSRPKCTQCDASKNFKLLTPPKHLEENHKGPGLCVCADGYGMVGTYIKKVTVGKNTVPVPQFSCEKCGDGQVPLVPKSGLFLKYDNESKTWSLKLRDDDEYPPMMAAMIAAKKASGCGKDDDDDKKEGGCKKGGPWENRDKPEVRPPWKPGQCVSCPEGAKTHDGIKCVAA